MGKLTGSSTEEIDAPLDEVWKVVEDVISAPDWQGGLSGMTALEKDPEGRATLVETENDIKVRTIKTLVRFDYSGAPGKLGWTQEKGDLKSVDGHWKLDDLGDGRTRATYELEVDTGRMIGMLVRGPVEGQVRKLLVEDRARELKQRVEG